MAGWPEARQRWPQVTCGLCRQAGQVTVAAVGMIFILVLLGAALVAYGGALTGKGRAQRAADLAALSAARSLRDDLPRRLSPPVVDGAPNPYHLTRSSFLARARSAALRAAIANGVSPARVTIRFPDHLSPAPLRAEVRLRAAWRDGGETEGLAVEARAEATLPLPASSSFDTSAVRATGGGYSGPLAIRQGKPMRPDVALAFDLMAAAAAAEGHHLVISSAYRSDAEQAALFAANPDPKWVAPPGTSLHRCGTELDLGPASAYGWLAANASRFGFVMRYPWEPWHAGYEGGPAPCSKEAERAVMVADARVGRGGGTLGGRAGGSRGTRGDGRLQGGAVLPAFVPARYAPLILRAASLWNVSASLLAAQLQAESNFNPNAVSSAGAQGIAQFMPGTAAAYGLSDPFDPAAAIMAQAHLMSDLLRQFNGSVELALAAYNAGPGAVQSCGCVPGYPETQAYVAKITGLLAGLPGGLGFRLPMEVRLVR